jgi:hypothetical protein
MILIAPLLSFRTKVNGSQCLAAEFLPYILAICRCNNAMIMAHSLPIPGQLRSTRRRAIRRHLFQLTEEQSIQLESVGQLQLAPTSILSNGLQLHSRFEAAIRCNLAV